MDNNFTLSSGLIAAYALSALVAYLLGSISFAIIYSWIFAKTDVRKLGSGNAGATNVFRSVGVWAGILTFVCDMGKGVLALVCSDAIIGTLVYGGATDSTATKSVGYCIAGLFAVLGHLYPVYFGFRGGKGVLTIAGIILMMSPIRFVFVFLVFATVFALTRTVSKGSCACALAYPIITFLYCWFGEHMVDAGRWPTAYVWMQTGLAVVLASLLLIKHRSNIVRILNGTEPKLVIKRSTKAA
ncbi:MAG: glycerol-3-phosphate 1-O-acyltransferase PlsY [Ruminococcaceae bacterium]|nr:glycerol-3-phosphate 1-O-acyltransferase PlsY [Oscillospiraceae bacterium]